MSRQEIKSASPSFLQTRDRIRPCPYDTRAHLSTLLSLLLGLQVVVGKVGRSTADKDKGIDADAQTGSIAGRCRRGDGGLLGLGSWVAGL